MKVKTHEQLRASMLCIIAFTLGCMVVFCSGCKAGLQTKVGMFGEEYSSGIGVYTDKE